MSAHGDPQHDNESVRFEASDVSSRPVVVSVVGLTIFTIVFTGVAHLVFGMLAERQRSASAPASPLAQRYGAKEPPAPRLQVDPRKDLELMLAAEDKILNNYGWIDKDAGIVQVPIGRAMEMLIAKGLPARQDPVPAKMAPRGVAPAQHPEASGAPDWIDAGHEAHSGHGDAGGGAGHESAPGKLGH